MLHRVWTVDGCTHPLTERVASFVSSLRDRTIYVVVSSPSPSNQPPHYLSSSSTVPVFSIPPALNTSASAPAHRHLQDSSYVWCFVGAFVLVFLSHSSMCLSCTYVVLPFHVFHFTQESYLLSHFFFRRFQHCPSTWQSLDCRLATVPGCRGCCLWSQRCN